MLHPFEYRRLGALTYHVLSEPEDIKAYLLKWILAEWEHDREQAPDEPWTVRWMKVLPHMEFRLAVMRLDTIHPNVDLMRGKDFIVSLNERAGEREESILRGISIEPLLVDQAGLELMDGYTRYTALQRLRQGTVYVYLGRA